MLLGELFPDFSAETSQGRIESFHRWMGNDSWAILFSHPADFTPVCTTELARAAQLASEFVRRCAKLIALSCNSVDSHQKWSDDIAAYGNSQPYNKKLPRLEASNFPFPIIGDEKRLLASKLGMLDPMNLDSTGAPLTVRAVFVVDPQKKLRLSILYPASTGRNFDEILRVVDSMQLSDKHMLATPEGWTPGSQCMVEPRVDDVQARKLFGDRIRTMELPSGRPYLRIVDQPLADNELTRNGRQRH